MLSRILRTIRDHGLVERGDRVLVAVSGGPDSTALLHGLLRLGPRLGVSLNVACIDHGLRQESGREAQTVAERCRALGVPCVVSAVDVGEARGSHVSVQEAARVVRLRALQGLAKQLGCTKVALGHTADDQAETVLFRIVRGTGLAGLAGIPYRRELLIRPLLDVRRAELLVYLTKRKIPFFTDPSNANRRYARSRIRHDVLPMLARENPRVAEALLALSHEARGRATAAWRDELPAGAYVPRRAQETVERLLQHPQGTRRVAVKGGEIIVRYGRIAWQPKSASPALALQPIEQDPIWPAGGLFRLFAAPAPAVEILPATKGAVPDRERASFDVARVEWPLHLRTWRPGDRMAPRFGAGKRKLSDLFIDAKIPRRERSTLPVLCDASDTILFVPGLRPSEAGRPSHDTVEWVEVRVAR